MKNAWMTGLIVLVAATGSFARMEGYGFLLMIERKVRWLQEHAEKLGSILGD